MENNNIFDSINTCNDLIELQNLLIEEDNEYENIINKITRSRLIYAWESGILNDKAYIYYIISMFYEKKELSNLDIAELSQLWEGIGINEKKPKELKPSSVNKALIDLQEAGIILIKNGIIEFDVVVTGL